MNLKSIFLLRMSIVTTLIIDNNYMLQVNIVAPTFNIVEQSLNIVAPLFNIREPLLNTVSPIF